jgi:hypothetical protein
MTDIAIYAEGGGDTTHQKAELRQGFDGLLKAEKSHAQEKRIGWKLICCGARQAAYEAFINAVEQFPDTINVLLVDSEEPIAALSGDEKKDAATGVAHLMRHDQWKLAKVQPTRIHLMAQCMEAWIVADPEALAAFYGQHFGKNHLPVRQNLEDEPKQNIYAKLNRATSDRNISKGQYGKIKHASQLLKLLDPLKVANRCPRFQLIHAWLHATIEAAAEDNLKKRRR